MKIVILAGGMGTRLAEETDEVPKPMVEIGDKPILWHIMKHFSHHGFNEFIIALGYKGEMIKDFFINYHLLSNSFTVKTKNGQIIEHDMICEDWVVHLIDTGLITQTGGRVKKLKELLKDETFILTYGDGISDIDLKKLVNFHRSHGKMATVTAVRPPARFGEFEYEGDKIIKFAEKPKTEEGWINGGYFVLEPEVLDYIENDDTIWERGPLEKITEEGELMAYWHDGFWRCMDNVRDLRYLRDLWAKGDAAWEVWE